MSLCHWFGLTITKNRSNNNKRQYKTSFLLKSNLVMWKKWAYHDHQRWLMPAKVWVCGKYRNVDVNILFRQLHVTMEAIYIIFLSIWFRKGIWKSPLRTDFAYKNKNVVYNFEMFLNCRFSPKKILRVHNRRITCNVDYFYASWSTS